MSHAETCPGHATPSCEPISRHRLPPLSLMHRLPLPPQLRALTPLSWTAIFALALLASPLHAQIRGNTQNPTTTTSANRFRTLQTLPSEDRGADPLLVQNSGTPIPAEPPTGPGNGPMGPGAGGGPPGGGGNSPFGGGGGFGGRGARGGAEAETFRIDGDKVSLQFPNNTISDILGIYERLTEKTLIKDTAIFEGQTISLVTPVPVEKAEAIKLIEAALLTNGYAIVAEEGGKSARILSTRAQGATGGQFSQGVKFFQSARDLPDNETIVSYFMPLAFLNPTEAATMLGGHVGLNPYGRITPVAAPPGLLITENANIVKQLISIQAVIDAPATASALVTKFIPLAYADAATVAQIVQATLDAQATDNQTKGITTIRGEQAPQPQRQGDQQQQQSQRTSAPQTQAGGQQGNNATAMRVRASSQVVADTRLNQVLVVAEPEEYAYITSLIAQFDRPVEVPEAYERKLKHIYSVDVISVLADLLRETTGGTTQLPGGGTLTQQTQSLTTSSNQFLTGRSTTNARGGTFTSGGGTTSETGTSVTSRPDQLIESDEDNAPISILISKTRIIADPLSNSIIVIGPKENQDKVEQLLEKLDRKSPQVYLATVIGQLTLGDGLQFGVDYLQKFTSTGSNSGLTSAFLGSREDIVTNNNVADMRDNLITSALSNVKGFNLYGQIGETLDVFVTALESTNKFKVLSRPSVFALNNKRAVITSGQSIPVPSTSLANANSSTANGTGNVTTTIEYKDVVLKLEVIPLINPDGDVTLRVAQVNDTVVGNQVVAQNNVPIIGTEQINTTVTVKTGHTVVLGGLITETETKDTEGIPVLSRIPGVGRLFREDVTSRERKELIIFIQPVVVNDDGSMRRASMSEDLRTQVGGDAAKVFPQQVVPKATSAPATVADPKKKRWFDVFKKRSEGDSTATAPARPPASPLRK